MAPGHFVHFHIFCSTLPAALAAGNMVILHCISLHVSPLFILLVLWFGA